MRLTLLEKVGPVNARKLVAYSGGAEAVFAENKKALCKIPGIGENLASHILAQDTMARAEQEMVFIIDNDIRPMSYLDEDFPNRLQHCEDAPVMLFSKGRMNLNAQKVISIVGTRNATEYGKGFIREFCAELAAHEPLVVSGLAYGVDINAHRESISKGIQTVAVMAHGLDRIYPGAHQKTARQMMENGGMLTEFVSETNPDRERFPMRNRIVAGLADATIVVESARSGGSMITAYLANGYNRDVFALPGRKGDKYSEGCNLLIRNDIAHLLDNWDEFEKLMGWNSVERPKQIQKELFSELSDDQQLLLGFLKDGPKTVDSITLDSKLPMSTVSPMLLELEFKGLVKCLPGKQYMLG